MDIVCFGQMNWDWCWTGKQQLMTRLAQRGHRVVYLDPQWEYRVKGFDYLRTLHPVSCDLGLREAAPRLFIYTHRYAPLLRWRLNVFYHPIILRALLARLEFTDPVVICMLPWMRELVKAANPRALVYYAIDEMSAYGGTPTDEIPQIRSAEETIARQADLVLAISPRLQAKFEQLNIRAQLLPSGADTEHFSPARLKRISTHPLVEKIRRPCLGVIGQIDERIDQEMLVEMAHARKDWNFILAGRVKQGVDVRRLAEEENIYLTGYLGYKSLPRVLKHFDVCLLPYKLNELTNSCSPLKVYEYLASGKPVVSAPLDGLGDCREVVAVAHGTNEFIAAAEEAMRLRKKGEQQRLRVAEENSWESRVDKLEGLLLRLPRAKTRLLRGNGYTSNAPAGRYGNRFVDTPSLKLSLFARTVNFAGYIYYLGRRVKWMLQGERKLRVKKILIARRSLLGDMIVFLPTLRALRRLYPQSEIVLGLNHPFPAPDLLPLLKECNEIRILDWFSSRSWPRNVLGSLRNFIEGFDLVISGASFFVFHEAVFSGARYRVGLYDGHPLQTFNTHLVPVDLTRHEADNNLALAEALGACPAEKDRIPALELDGALGKEKQEEALRILRLDPSAQFLVIHPGASRESRRWPELHFAQLCELVLNQLKDTVVILSGVDGERELNETVRGLIDERVRRRVLNAAGRLDLLQFCALLQGCLAFVCNDTGVMHLARALGVPLLALLGPENHKRWGPYPVGPAPAAALRYQVPCAACARRYCEYLYCMKSLQPSLAAKELLALIEERRGTGNKNGDLFVLREKTFSRSWTKVAADFDLPLVSVVAAIADGGGEEDGTRRVVQFERLVQAVEEQTYPKTELIVLIPPNERLLYLSRQPKTTVRIVFLELQPGEETELWRKLLAASHGGIISVFSDPAFADPQKLSLDVATILRNPTAKIVLDGPGRKIRSNSALSDFAGSALRRSWIEQANEGSDAQPETLGAEDVVPAQTILLG